MIVSYTLFSFLILPVFAILAYLFIIFPSKSDRYHMVGWVFASAIVACVYIPFLIDVLASGTENNALLAGAITLVSVATLSAFLCVFLSKLHIDDHIRKENIISVSIVMSEYTILLISLAWWVYSR